MSATTSTTTTVNISMPTKIRDAMRDRMAEGGFENASEYVRHLIREDWKKAAQRKLEQELLEGEASGPGERFDEGWLARRQAELESRLKKARKD